MDLIKDFSEITSAEIKQLAQLVLSTFCLIVVLAQNLLLEQLYFAFVFDLLLLLPLLETHDLLFLHLKPLLLL